MRNILIPSILAVLLIGVVVLTRQQAAAQSGPVSTPDAQLAPQTGAAGDIQSPLAADALSSFTVSNPYCYQQNPAIDECSINFRYIQTVDNQTSAPYMTWLAITISGKKRYNATAFFEGVISYSYDMIPGGIKVPCGLPNAGGAGNAFGNVYGVTIQPLDSSRNPMSTDIANVTCPAFAP
jgi:hypothetical protein